MYVMVLALAEPQARATPEKHHLLPFRHFGCFFVAASLCLAVSPCGSFVLVVESVGQALFNPYLLFIKKKIKKKEYICARLVSA